MSIRLGIAIGCTAVALAAAAQPAGATPLVLREFENGPILPKGTTLGIVFNEAEPTEAFCTFIGSGKLTVNSSEADVISGALPLNCGGANTWTGTLKTVRMTSSGAIGVVFSPRLAVTSDAGVCHYTAGRLTGAFTLPGYFEGAFTSVVAARTTSSPAGCPRKQQIVAFTEILDGNHYIYAET